MMLCNQTHSTIIVLEAPASNCKEILPGKKVEFVLDDSIKLKATFADGFVTICRKSNRRFFIHTGDSQIKLIEHFDMLDTVDIKYNSIWG